MGGSAAQIDALRGEELDASLFSGAELAALRYAGELTRRSTAVPDRVFIELADHFDEGAIIEITLVAGLFNYFNLVNNALRVEPTR